MPLDQHVVRTLPQFHQGAGDDVDEAPGKFPESRRVAFTGELPCNAGRHLADTSKAPHGAVARGNVRPAQMEDIELALAARALSLDVHQLQQIGIPFGVADDNYLVLSRRVLSPDV